MQEAFTTKNENWHHMTTQNAIWAFFFWSGVVLFFCMSGAVFSLLVIFAAFFNLVMILISPDLSTRFPDDSQIQIMEKHVLGNYVNTHIEHLCVDLRICAGGMDVKCLAHCLLVKSKKCKAKTLLLVHGNAASAASFAECFDLLSLDFNILALDLPGFGRTRTELDSTARGRKIMSSMDIEFWVDFIAKFLDARELTDVTLLGHSYGGYISVKFAELNPLRVTGLILLDCVGIFPTLGKLGSYWAVFFKLSIAQLLRYYMSPIGAWVCLTKYMAFGHTVETLYWFALTQNPHGWGDICIANEISLSWIGSYWKNPALSSLLRLTCPVITIYGTDDCIVPIHQGYILQQVYSIPCFGIPDAGHSPLHGHNALIFSETVRNFFRSTGSNLKTKEVIIPNIQWQSFVSTFSLNYTSKLIDKLYDYLRNESCLSPRQ